MRNKISFLRPTFLPLASVIGATLACYFTMSAPPMAQADTPDPFTSITQQFTPPETAISPNLLSATQAMALLRAVHDPYWDSAKTTEFKLMSKAFPQQPGAAAHVYLRRMLLEGDTHKMDIALTFDDGPHADATPELLSILEKNNVHATFFLVGEKAEQDPQLVQEEMADGDAIGNHTYNHVSLVKIPRRYVATEIKACGETLNSITGETPVLFRPPGGAFDPKVSETSAFLGYTTVLWTDDPGDYMSPGADVILKRVLTKATPGGIILLHDGINQTMQILPALIQTLRRRGYHFVTIPQMLADGGAHLSEPRVSLLARN